MVIIMHIVYGGSFNPPTKAHFQVYFYLKRKLPLTTFTFLPVGTVYGKDDLTFNDHRYNMLKIMTKGYDDINVSPIELNDPHFKGTYQSLKRLKNSKRLAFVIGADNLKTLHRWKNIHKMLTEFECIVLNRDHKDLASYIERDWFLSYYKHRFIMFNDFDYPVSASEYRKTHNDDLIVPDVIEYIRKHNLYRGDNHVL